VIQQVACGSVNDRGMFNLYVKFDWPPEPFVAIKQISRACLELNGLHFEVWDPLNFQQYSCHQKSAYTILHCCNWQHNPASPNAPAFQFNILLGIAQPSLSITRFRVHSKICVLVKCLRPAAGAVQQSAVCSRSQSQGARGGTNSGNLFCTGSAMCCESLCKWLHWKQRFADCTGSTSVRGKLVQAAGFCYLLCKQLLLLASVSGPKGQGP